MIKYNSNTISDWNYGDDNIIKVYRHNAVCYYKVIQSGGTTSQTPCFAVVDDISQYQETEFEDVFNKADESWYKLNNLNQYEKYGLYGSGLTITTYEGKLTVDDGYEYQYSGGSWVNVGQVSGGTASLPNVPFTVNYNAKNYDSSTKTLAKTSGQLADVDAVITAGTPTVNNGYLTIASGTRASISGYQTYFNRDSNNPNLTIISKQLTNGSNCHLFANRASNYNWMYRPTSTKLNFHGSSQIGGTDTTTQPVIESIRVDSNRLLTFNNYTDNTTSTTNNFTYGNTNSGGVGLFAGYYNSGSEWFVGDFYWIYMSQTTLTDDQVQQVIAYNEGGGSQPIYPIEYAEKADPPNDLVFSTMEQALAYECPWVGMTATIAGVDYVFDEEYNWITRYQWVVVLDEYICDKNDKYQKLQKQERNADGTWTSLPIYQKGELIEESSEDCAYTEYEYIRNANGNYRYRFNTNFYPTTANTIEIKMELVDSSIDWGRLICWSSCGGDTCDNSQFRFTTVTSNYAIITRLGSTSGVLYQRIGANIPITVTMPLSQSFGTYNSGTTDYYFDYNVNESWKNYLPSSTPMTIWNLGNDSDNRYAAVCKIYYIKVYDAYGTVIKHYIPSDYDGAPCFYEKVNGEFITDTYTGTYGGTCTLGPEINT